MDAKQQLIEGLNIDLANEYQAIITYITYASTVTGVNREEMKEFFMREVPEELRHAEFLANKIAALGGQPTTIPAEVPPASNLKEMLINLHKAEVDTIERYRQRREQAEKIGDYGLVNDLEDLISDETRHKEALEMILRGL